MNNRTRRDPYSRKAEILSAAVKLAKKKPFNTIKRGEVAEAAGVSLSLVNHYFGDVNGLHAAIMREAVRSEHLAILASGIAAKHPAARRAPKKLKDRALATIGG